MWCGKRGNGSTPLMLQSPITLLFWIMSRKNEEWWVKTILLLRSSFGWHSSASRCGISYCPTYTRYYCLAVVTLKRLLSKDVRLFSVSALSKITHLKVALLASASPSVCLHLGVGLRGFFGLCWSLTNNKGNTQNGQKSTSTRQIHWNNKIQQKSSIIM